MAAAPSPLDISTGLAALAPRFSAATTSVSLSLPSASISAEVPARWVAATSMVETPSSRLSAPATMPECSRSRNGKVVEAKRSAAMLPRSRPASASRAASTAMVTASSSQLQKARSPLAWPFSAGLNQPCVSAIALRGSRRQGM